MSDLFRKSALEKLSSPEQLDCAVVITPPSFWLVFLGGALIVAGLLLWAVFGRIPLEVDADGIYVGGTSGTYSESVEGTGSMAAEGTEIKKVIGDEKEALCYIPVRTGKKVVPGMEVMIYPTTVNKQEYGHMTGTVVSVSPYVASRSEMSKKLGDDTLVSEFLSNGPVVEVVCSIKKDPKTVSGYYWSNRKGADVSLTEGTMLEASIVTERKAPITMLIPYLKEMLSESAPSNAQQTEG